MRPADARVTFHGRFSLVTYQARNGWRWHWEDGHGEHLAWGDVDGGEDEARAEALALLARANGGD